MRFDGKNHFLKIHNFSRENQLVTFKNQIQDGILAFPGFFKGAHACAPLLLRRGPGFCSLVVAPSLLRHNSVVNKSSQNDSRLDYYLPL